MKKAIPTSVPAAIHFPYAGRRNQNMTATVRQCPTAGKGSAPVGYREELAAGRGGRRAAGSVTLPAPSLPREGGTPHASRGNGGGLAFGGTGRGPSTVSLTKPRAVDSTPRASCGPLSPTRTADGARCSDRTRLASPRPVRRRYPDRARSLCCADATMASPSGSIVSGSNPVGPWICRLAFAILRIPRCRPPRWRLRGSS